MMPIPGCLHFHVVRDGDTPGITLCFIADFVAEVTRNVLGEVYRNESEFVMQLRKTHLDLIYDSPSAWAEDIEIFAGSGMVQLLEDCERGQDNANQ
jgi:quinol monooxygenase YgiN